MGQVRTVNFLDEILYFVCQKLALVVVRHNLNAVVKLVVTKLLPHVHDIILTVVHTVHLIGVHKQHAAFMEAINSHFFVMKVNIHLLVTGSHTLIAEKFH